MYPEHPVVTPPTQTPQAAPQVSEQVGEFPVVTPVEIGQQSVAAEPTKKMPRQRHFLILFFFSFMWGTFGVDRMYMGLWGTGILKLLTLGGLGFWTLSDFIIIMTGTFQDKQGRVALQAAEYKKFASRTVFWFTVILAVFILLNGIALIIGIFQAVNLFQGGGTSGLNIPGLDGLSGGSDQSQINSLLSQ